MPASRARRVTATYRLQLRREFALPNALALVPYFARLGVSHLYLSPILAAKAGSTHGYDVVDHSRLNPELGTEADLRALAAKLHEHGMGILLDIVPNHMSASEENPYWDDVLARGTSSRFAEWFDIEWDAPRAEGKLVVPALGAELNEVLDRGELKLRVRDGGARVEYFGRTFPLDPATLPGELQLAQLDKAAREAVEEWGAGQAGKRRLKGLLAAQHYRLCFWRHVEDINYRRFFDVNDLAALRMENDAVFQPAHALLLSWVRDGVLDGLRLDHVDGLRSPSWYLKRLRSAVDEARHAEAPSPFPIYVEKILARGESLPGDWPVQGTTGYDFMNEVEDLFINEEGYRAIEANYRGLRHTPALRYRSVAHDGKRRVLTGPLRADVARIARLVNRWRSNVSEEDAANAIVEFIVHLDVYRTYLTEPGQCTEADRHAISQALTAARESVAAGKVAVAAIKALDDAFLAPAASGDGLRSEIVLRMQQTSGPAAAKGVEDTALYVYLPLVSRNEVGGEPDTPLSDAAGRAHARNLERARSWPEALLAVNTHDAKRSADIRSRLDVLTMIPEDWARHVLRWRKLNRSRKRVVRGKPAPDTNTEYLFYQSLLGVWPAARPGRRADDLPDQSWLAQVSDRLAEYMLKAAREAKTRTSWVDSNAQYEKALDGFIRETMTPASDAPFLADVARFTALVARPAFSISLARIAIQFTAPGIPDTYQGDESWSFSFVDPDNRRPVDFGEREAALKELARGDKLGDWLSAATGILEWRVKLALVARLLRFRQEHPALFKGNYLPLDLGGQWFAFARLSEREACLTLARRTFKPAKPPGTASRKTASASQGDTPPPGPLPSVLSGVWVSQLTGRRVDLRDAGQLSPAGLIGTAAPCDVLLRSQ